MFFTQPADFVVQFVNAVDAALRTSNTEHGLSRLQRRCLSFCLMAVMITNTICWARFARACLGRFTPAAFSWFCLRALMSWDAFLCASVQVVLRKYGITEGTLVIDDTDKKRSKSTTCIFGVSKLKDKATGGYVQGQCIVQLLLVTPTLTLPVGFALHRPDPAIKAWNTTARRLKAQGISRKELPAKPKRDAAYPTKIEIGLTLLMAFKKNHPDIAVRSVLADAAYGTAHFLDTTSALYDGVQVVSELRCNQLVQHHNKTKSLDQVFRRAGVARMLIVRGEREQSVVVDSARMHVTSHGVKRFIIAIKYDGETEYRYLAASRLDWRTEDIVRVWTLRWLIEVFFEDWKGHAGWDALTKQQGEDGSRRGLILSLLVDHCLLTHPAQLARIKHKLPAYTVGSLVNQIRADAIVTMIREIVSEENPQESLERMAQVIRENFSLNVSKKHMVGRNLGRQKPSKTLRYRQPRSSRTQGASAAA